MTSEGWEGGGAMAWLVLFRRIDDGALDDEEEGEGAIFPPPKSA